MSLIIEQIFDESYHIGNFFLRNVKSYTHLFVCLFTIFCHIIIISLINYRYHIFLVSV